MASKVKGGEFQGLQCPVCLDVFKDPTLLSCGHTFCKGCLETCDEQHYDLDHIICPVCRKTTNLGQNRVAGLTPNFLALGIQDELRKVAPSPSFCPLHRQVHNDIFCVVCNKFICLTCYLDNHKDHNIKKKEELEGYMRKKKEKLIQKSKTRKTEIETSLNIAEQKRIDIHCHFSYVEKKIQDEFAKRVTILQKEEKVLLKKLYHIQKDTEIQVEGCMAKYGKLIDSINRSSTVLRSYMHVGQNIGSDTIKLQHLQCNYLENSLKKIIDEESMDRLKQTAKSTWFYPSDENLLALGHIKEDVKVTSNIQRAKTAAGAYKKAEQVASGRNVAVRPALVGTRSKSMNIVRMVDAPGAIWGMSALSQDAVVVGYGSDRLGSDCFFVRGERTEHLDHEVGEVYDIVLFADSRSVVSQHGQIHMYSSRGAHSGLLPYRCTIGEFPARLCSDQYSNIYAVNSYPNGCIYLFHGSSCMPQRVIPTGDIYPSQICVTKTSVLITSTCDVTPSTVTVFDREGHVGSSITASGDDEHMYAAVDSQDRVLIAKVRPGYDVLELTRFTLQGTTLIQETKFKELKIHEYECNWAYMISLSDTLLTFANRNHLHFIDLGV